MARLIKNIALVYQYAMQLFPGASPPFFCADSTDPAGGWAVAAQREKGLCYEGYKDDHFIELHFQ